MDYTAAKNILFKRGELRLIKKLKKQSQKSLDCMLFDAIENRDDILTYVLIENGANPNAINSAGETPLMYASHFASEKCVDILLTHGVNPNAVAKTGFSVIMDEANAICVNYQMPTAYKNRYNSYLKHRCGGVNALHYAAASKMYGSTESIINKLMDTNSLDINLQDAYGYTPLMYAVENGNFDAAKALIKHGANPNLQNKDGDTALTIALSMMHIPYMAKLLVINGADPSIKNSSGKSAQDIAAERKQIMGADWLERAEKYKQINKSKKTVLKFITDQECEMQK